MPKADFSVDVDGRVKPRTSSDTGTITSPRPEPVTGTEPLHVPAAASSGTSRSNQIARGSLGGIANGQAFRFSPTYGSLSGMSGSGQAPVAPSVLDGVETW